jgi:hypothetical protein
MELLCLNTKYVTGTYIFSSGIWVATMRALVFLKVLSGHSHLGVEASLIPPVMR